MKYIASFAVVAVLCAVVFVASAKSVRAASLSFARACFAAVLSLVAVAVALYAQYTTHGDLVGFVSVPLAGTLLFVVGAVLLGPFESGLRLSIHGATVGIRVMAVAIASIAVLGALFYLLEVRAQAVLSPEVPTVGRPNTAPSSVRVAVALPRIHEQQSSPRPPGAA